MFSLLVSRGFEADFLHTTQLRSSFEPVQNKRKIFNYSPSILKRLLTSGAHVVIFSAICRHDTDATADNSICVTFYSGCSRVVQTKVSHFKAATGINVLHQTYRTKYLRQSKILQNTP
jgi:hypothetical protein